MSIAAAALRGVYKASGVKKQFSLPEEELLKVLAKQNEHRGFFMPKDHKAFYRKKVINGFPCLVVQQRPTPADRGILFFFGGGIVIGPDEGDAVVLRRLCKETGSDVRFPRRFPRGRGYPLFL